jgi:hypothetical protein
LCESRRDALGSITEYGYDPISRPETLTHDLDGAGTGNDVGITTRRDEVHADYNKAVRTGIRPGGDVAGRSPNLKGTFYVDLHVLQGPRQTRPTAFSREDLVRYHWTLSDQFASYIGFDCDRELAVSIGAWIEAIVLTLQELESKRFAVRVVS